MDVIKEQAPNHCVVRSELHSRSLAHIMGLFEEARNDFPDLKPEDVNVVQYSGKSYSGTRGVEFVKPKDTKIPESYKPIPQLELTF